MKYEFTGRHLEVTPALRTHVETHFDKIRHLLNGNNSSAHVILEVERGRHRAEIVLKWRDHVLTATSTVSDMYQALSKTIDKLEKQALRLKNKVIDKHHKAQKAASISAETETVSPDAIKPGLVKVEQYTVKPMTADEATLQIKNGDDQFVVFRDSESERISVVYRRKDGNYGLIQP